MTTLQPPGVIATAQPSDLRPSVPEYCADRLWECARLQWWLSSGTDPALLIQEFLASHDLPGPGWAPSHADSDATTTHRDEEHCDGTVCGAVVHVSAAAAAAMVLPITVPPITVPPITVPVRSGQPHRFATRNPAPGVPDVVIVVYRHGSSYPPAAVCPPSHWRVGRWRPSWTAAQHAEAVQLARAAIAQGELYQVNLVGHASAPFTGDPLAALHRVAGLAGAGYRAVLTGTGWAIACASPETLLTVRNGTAVTRPIKGTRPATAAGRRQLLRSAKERAEHIMIVDLERNDLSRVAQTGSVHLDRLYALQRWCDLWQAESSISARLRPGVRLAEVLRALCPPGSVTGAPKLAALSLIDALEPVGRGPSMGALGWVGRDHVDLGLTIRTVAVDGDRLHAWAGGGITWGSRPAAEVAEASAKLAPIMSVLARG